MNTSATKIFAKILVFPAIFSFAFSCCQPMFSQAAELNNTHSEGHLRQTIPQATESTIQEGHHCDHEKKIQEQTIQAPTKKITADLSLFNTHSSPIPRHADPRINLDSVVRTPITGPPWIGKNIKGFLGVYRS